MNKSTTFLLILFATLGVLSAAAFYGMIWYVDSLNNNSVALEQTYTNSQIKLKNVQSTARTVRSAGDSLDKLEDYMVKPGQELPIVKSIEQLAAAASLTEKTDLLGIDQSPTLTSQNKEFLHIVISTGGTFDRTMNFLSILETLPYNVKMNKVTLTAGATASSTATVWNASFDLSLVKEKDNS